MSRSTHIQAKREILKRRGKKEVYIRNAQSKLRGDLRKKEERQKYRKVERNEQVSESPCSRESIQNMM